MGGIYYVCHSDGLRWHDTHTKFMAISSGIQAILKVLLQQLERLIVGITDERGL
jgi:hypothetical protein